MRAEGTRKEPVDATEARVLKLQDARSVGMISKTGLR